MTLSGKVADDEAEEETSDWRSRMEDGLWTPDDLGYEATSQISSDRKCL